MEKGHTAPTNQSPPRMTIPVATTIDDLILEVVAAFDDDVYDQHRELGTVKQLYTDTITNIVYNLSVMPVARELEGGIPPSEEDVMAGFGTIVERTAKWFEKPLDAVLTDYTKLMDTFPVEDVRQSYLARESGLLN